MRGGDQHQTRPRRRLGAFRGIETLGVDGDRNDAETRRGERRARRRIARILDPRLGTRGRHHAGGQIDPLLRARHHDHLIGGAGDAAGLTEILGDRLAKPAVASGIIVAHRMGRPFAQEPRRDARPIAPGKAIERGHAGRQRQETQGPFRHEEDLVVPAQLGHALPLASGRARDQADLGLAFGRGDEEARAGPAREKALGDEAVVGFDHGDPRDIVVGGEDAGGGDASSTLEPAAQHGVAEIGDDLVLQRRRRGSVERETAPER